MLFNGHGLSNLYIKYSVKIDAFNTIHGTIEGLNHYYQIEEGFNLSDYHDVSNLDIEEVFKLYGDLFNCYPNEIYIDCLDFLNTPEELDNVGFFKDILEEKDCFNNDITDEKLKELSNDYMLYYCEERGCINNSSLLCIDFSEFERLIIEFENLTNTDTTIDFIRYCLEKLLSNGWYTIDNEKLKEYCWQIKDGKITDYYPY